MTEPPRVPFNRDAYQQLIRRACFICELLADNPDYRHHVIHRDDHAIAFLNKTPSHWGHVLVAPVTHREHAVDDFALDDYLALQRVIHAAGQALTATVTIERLYVLSLGSQQGNRHVHWHLAPLPRGVPYDDQQLTALSFDRGYLDVPDHDMAALADALRRRVAQILG
ncbi:HIT family protein [Cryptosporangium japonicum]|uniref:HIT domain-containing protein n=1 Tax=Cryptosporangium japonicum TaxID=80872 RepID=A0ABP3EIZ7_9ACTN